MKYLTLEDCCIYLFGYRFELSAGHAEFTWFLKMFLPINLILMYDPDIMSLTRKTPYSEMKLFNPAIWCPGKVAVVKRKYDKQTGTTSPDY